MLDYISLVDVETAYKKYKSYVYYDNTNLLLRKQIAEFESDIVDIDIKLEQLYSWINNANLIGGELVNGLDPYFENLKNELSYWKFPKRIESAPNNNEQLIKNFSSNKEILIDKYIYHVNAPVELHIIAVLWIMKEGQYLVNNIENNYGYVLDKNEDNTDIISGLRLFKPYFNEYQMWRDKSIRSAKNILNEGQNTAIISLDLKNFYHSVRLDFSKIEEELSHTQNTTLTKILKEIYLLYTDLLVLNEDEKISEGKSILPIGFLSSGILANWYMTEFDNAVNNKINPVYYGRYVDDILISLPMGSLNKYNTTKEVILDYFVNHEILEEIEKVNNEDQDSYKVVGYEDLEIQEEKIIIMLFDKNEPTAVLDKFKNEIRKNSSEYRFLPNEELINESFDEASSKLIYDGSKNKLRSIKEFQDDKFGISSFLAKKIFLVQQSDTPKNQAFSTQIINFFKGSRSLEYFSLWEKIFTLFVLNNDIHSILLFKKKIENTFQYINSTSKLEIVENYKIYLNNVISLAISIKVDFYKEIEQFDEYIDLAKQFRKSRLIRKTYSKSVLAELVNHIDNRHSKYIDLTEQNIYFRLNMLKEYKFYPRYIHYHEIVLANYINLIHKGTIENSKKEDIFQQTKEIFFNISNSNCETLNQIDFENNDSDKLDKFILQKNTSKNKLKIGVANIIVDKKIFEKSYIRKPTIDLKRKTELVKLLNQAIEEKVDLIVLPECSIPYSWLHWIVNYAHKKQIGLVFGLEHVLSNKVQKKKQKAYNLIVTLLPIHLKKYSSLFIDIRVKKYYSPEEDRILRGYGYEIPKGSTQAIYDWKNVHFTTFNCFELADIHDRAKFKSKVDLVVASEYNRDTKYFSNIVESSARDLHCYFVQSNSSNYGDNRIYRPSNSNYSDILKIKGGENSTLLVGTIDIKGIREFQLKEYELQKDDGSFKPTPPDYNRDVLNKRIEESEI